MAGSLILPLKVRKALGIEGAGVVVLAMEGGEAKLSSVQHSVRKAQEIYRTHVKNDESTDSFLAERRAEAAKERADENS